MTLAEPTARCSPCSRWPCSSCCSCGIWLGGHPKDLPSFARVAFVRRPRNARRQRSDRPHLQRLLPAHRQEPARQRVDRRRRRRASAIASRTTSPRSEFREFNAAAELHRDRRGGRSAPRLHAACVIAHVFDGSPAARAGMKVGDTIVAVNGRSLDGLSSDKDDRADQGPARHRRDACRSSAASGTHTTTRTVTATRATISEPVVGLRDAHRQRRQARRRRAGDVQPRRARRSARSRRTPAAQRRARDRARPARQRRRARRGGAADREHLHRARARSSSARAGARSRSQTLTRSGDAIPAVDPDGGARRQQHRLGLGDRHRRAAGPPSRDGRRHAHLRQGRLPGGGAARPTAARWTSPSASTSRPTGATSAAAASSRARASTPEVAIARTARSTPSTASTSRSTRSRRRSSESAAQRAGAMPGVAGGRPRSASLRARRSRR